jgi:hypothetical protein
MHGRAAVARLRDRLPAERNGRRCRCVLSEQEAALRRLGFPLLSSSAPEWDSWPSHPVTFVLNMDAECPPIPEACPLCGSAWRPKTKWVGVRRAHRRD